MTADRDNIQDWIIYPMKHLIPPESNFSIIFQQMASRLTAAAVAVALLLCVVSFDNQVHGITATFTKTVLGKQGESITQNLSVLSPREEIRVLTRPAIVSNSCGWRDACTTELCSECKKTLVQFYYWFQIAAPHGYDRTFSAIESTLAIGVVLSYMKGR